MTAVKLRKKLRANDSWLYWYIQTSIAEVGSDLWRLSFPTMARSEQGQIEQVAPVYFKVVLQLLLLIQLLWVFVLALMYPADLPATKSCWFLPVRDIFSSFFHPVLQCMIFSFQHCIEDTPYYSPESNITCWQANFKLGEKGKIKSILCLIHRKLPITSTFPTEKT